jgi:hypothetical protein
MRKLVGSIVIGLALVLALMLFVDTSLALRTDVGEDAADQPPRRAGFRLPVPPLGELDPPPTRGKPENFKGTIEQLPPDTITGTWWIAIQAGDVISVEVTDQTKIIPPRVNPEEGDAVHVLARREGSILMAKHVVIKKERTRRTRPSHIRGEIEELPTPAGTVTGTWMVNGISVTVDEETKIRPKDRTPEIGMWANVLAFEQEDGSLLAAKIALQSREEMESEVEFEGPIESLPEEGLLGIWTVDGISVIVTEDTRLKGVTPAVGLNAEVEGELQEDQSVLASKVKVEGPEREKVEFEGTVVATDTIPGEWWIRTDSREISVTVTISTHINEDKGRLEPGAWVEVKAVEQTDGTLEAIYIKVEDGPAEDREIEFEGVIEALPPSAPHAYHGPWTIVADGTTVTVIASGNTEIEGEYPPEQGATVAVEGVLQREGLVKAHRIVVIEPPPAGE